MDPPTAPPMTSGLGPEEDEAEFETSAGAVASLVVVLLGGDVLTEGGLGVGEGLGEGVTKIVAIEVLMEVLMEVSMDLTVDI